MPETKAVVAQDNSSDAWRGDSDIGGASGSDRLTFLFTLFLLLQYKDLRDRVVRVIGTDNMTETTAAMSDAGERLSALFYRSSQFSTHRSVSSWAAFC